MRLVGLVAVCSVALSLCSAGCAQRTPAGDRGAQPSGGSRMVLVAGGVAQAPIVVAAGSPLFTRQAAEELAVYIEKTGGVRPEIIEGLPDPLPASALWVGYQPVLRELFPETDFDFNYPEEILIVCDGKNLAVLGRDIWNPEHTQIEVGRGKLIDGRQVEYGTVNAVYTFLQDYLGLRWLWPGESGEDVLAAETIAFAPFTHRYHPQIRGRSGMLNFSGFPGGGYGISRDWTRRQRLQLSSIVFSGGHAFSDWWGRFHKDHPEYFALQPDGTRGGGEKPFPGARTVKICHANPAVARQWLAQVEEQLAKDPNRTMFSASPNDGWSSGHCICEDCRAWDHPDGELRMFHWAGITQEYVALSDRDVNFANVCGRLLKERFPDKDYYVLMMSYGHSRPAPVTARPDDNVVISCVANFFGRTDLVDRGSTRGQTFKQQYLDWAAKVPALIWRPNTGSPAGWQQGQPDISINQTIADFKLVASNKCVGIFIDSVWEHWATQGPQYYVMGQLAWNPELDAQVVLDDYYRRGFGSAARAIKDYWELLEHTRAEFVSGDRGYPEVYNAGFFKKAYRLLDRADRAVARAPEKYAQRVAFVRAGLDYTSLIIEVRGLMAQLRASRGADTAAADQARANWEKIEQLCRDYPAAINWGPIRPQTPRMRSLHPDFHQRR